MKTHACFLILLPLLMLASLTAGAVSMGEIDGQIINRETRQPIKSAVVVFENAFDKITVQANENGYYYAEHVPTGRYQMRVEYNGRIFFMNRIRVYDSYTSMVNMRVSWDESLPIVVELERTEPIINPLMPHDIVLASTGDFKGPISLAELLRSQPGVDVKNGQIFIKGSSNGVRFFIDGCPVMAPASLREY